MPNLLFLGLGIWMIGTGVDGVPAPSSVVKVIGGIIVIIAAFVGA
jgi:hypothetical protein